MGRGSPSRKNSVLGPALAVGGASAIGSGVASAGGATLTTCPPGDESFYCQFVKGFNIFKMLLFIIGVIVLLWIIFR